MSCSCCNKGPVRLFLWIGSVGLALVFLASAIAKLADPGRFLMDVQAFRLLPYWAAYGVSIWVPWLELVCALALLVPRYAAAAASLAVAMTLGFILFIASAWARGLELDCGCFGDWLIFPSFGSHIAFNVGLLAIGCFIICKRWPSARSC